MREDRGRFQWSAIRPVCCAAIFAALAAALATAGAMAQSLPTATRKMDISAFGGYLYSTPDFGPYKNNGIALGADVTRYFAWPVAPSFEVRGNFSSGQAVSEHSLLVGLRLQGNLYVRFHPYVDFLAGGGTLIFAQDPEPGYHQDSGLALSYGGGVDMDVTEHFGAKVDVQYQSWNLGQNAYFEPGGDDFTLTPKAIVVGVVYHIPFRSR